MAMPNDEQGKPSSRDFPLRGAPSYGSYFTPTGEDAEVIHLFECGECEAPSPYVRSYSLLTIILLPPVGMACRIDDMMKCPRCMRWHIIVRLPLTILLSNLVSPIVVVWWLVVF